MDRSATSRRGDRDGGEEEGVREGTFSGTRRLAGVGEATIIGGSGAIPTT